MGRPHRHLRLFRGSLPDEQVELPPGELGDLLINLVTTDADRMGEHYSTQGNDRNLGGATSDVNNHAPSRFVNRQSRTNRGGHRFFNEVRLAGTSIHRGILYRALLDFCYARRHTDDDPGTRSDRETVMDLADEIPKHVFDGFEVRNDPVTQRTDSHDVRRRASDHSLGFGANRQDAAGSLVHRHNRGFGDHHTLVSDIHQGVCGPEINANVLGKQTKERAQRTGHHSARRERSGKRMYIKGGPSEAYFHQGRWGGEASPLQRPQVRSNAWGLADRTIDRDGRFVASSERSRGSDARLASVPLTVPQSRGQTLLPTSCYSEAYFHQGRWGVPSEAYFHQGRWGVGNVASGGINCRYAHEVHTPHRTVPAC